MKCFAALTPKSAGNGGHDSLYTTLLDGQPVSFALVEQPDIDFDADDPAHADSILISVDAFSCNFRERGRAIAISRESERSGYIVLGSEFSGVVRKLGNAVTDFAVGDRVSGDNSVDFGLSRPGLATQRASAGMHVYKRDKLMRLPSDMPIAFGAALGIGAQTAYAMVARLPDICGQHVAVTAASSNTSLFAIQALHARGAIVHALTTSEAKKSRLAKLGIEHFCVLSRDRNPDDAISGYLKERGLNGFDAVVDPFADIYLSILVKYLRRFGTYITCGVYGQSEEQRANPLLQWGVDTEQLFSLLIRKSITFIGNNLGLAKHLEDAILDYSAGRLWLPVDCVLGEEDLPAFVERSFVSNDRFGKVVFTYS